MTSDAGDDIKPEDRSGVAHIEALLAAAGHSSHYRVLSQVGSGGTGVVYKAIDTRLNRAVAIKAIHGSQLMDARHTARLRTEALAAASLDHPYICKIYELIETGDEKLIVMEFLEGETLSGILRRGSLPLIRTIQLAIEIAEGLANAHEHGLVHRDLKPANVMVTPHGHIKLLDFGLARADAASTPTADTQTASKATDAYAGTPYYMAPEQAAGRPITARADLFSFGVVLFECVTGVLPFKGTSPYDYVGHLLSDEPTPVARLAPDAPGDLARLIDRCLNKTPAQRPDSATTVVDALRRLADALSSSGDGVRTVRAEGAQTRWRLVATVGAIAVVAALTWRWYPRPASNDIIWRSRPFVTSPGDKSGSRISPDGRWISFLSTVGGATQVLVQRINGGEPQQAHLPAGTPMSQLWSPDGGQLAYALRQGDTVLLQIVPAFFGGAPLQTVPMVPAPTGARLLRWIDRSIYVEMNDRRGRLSLQRVDLDRATMTSVTDGWTVAGALRGFDVRPDGKRVVFTALAGGQEDLWVANLDGTSTKQLTDDRFFERSPLWSGPGASVLYESNRGGQTDLWEIWPESGRSRSLTSSQTVEVPESTSADGAVVSFLQESKNANLWQWDPVANTNRQLTNDSLSDFSPTSTAGGSRIAFQRTRPSPVSEYPILDSTLFSGALGGAGFQVEPLALADGFAARLSPDGSRLVYLQRNADLLRATLLVKDLATGGTTSVSLTCPRPAFSVFPVEWAEQNVAWSPSSTELYFVDWPGGWTVRRYRVGAEGPESPFVTAKTGEHIHDLIPSADGRLLAYVVSSTNGSALHLFDVRSGDDRSLPSFRGAVYPRGWLPEGGLVLARSLSVNEDFTAEIEVVVAAPGGALKRVGLVDRAFIATTRLDPTRAVLYVTQSERGVHNLYAVSVTTGAVRRVTENTLPGVTFSGIEPLGGGPIVGVRDQRQRDIWLLDIVTPTEAAGNREGR